VVYAALFVALPYSGMRGLVNRASGRFVKRRAEA
jgi:hypothetical protein